MAAVINVSENDFNTLAAAARDAQRQGNTEQAEALDRIARKVNAALAIAASGDLRWARGTTSFTWQDVPSVLEPLRRKGPAA